VLLYNDYETLVSNIQVSVLVNALKAKKNKQFFEYSKLNICNKIVIICVTKPIKIFLNYCVFNRRENGKIENAVTT